MIRILLHIALLITIVFVMYSCNRTDHDHKKPPLIYKTQTAKTIIINETHPFGQSLSNIEITTKDFEYNFSETFKDVDPISSVYVADLDNNSFDEIYIVTTSSGSGSYGRVMGFASNWDKSLSMINFPEAQKSDQKFEGYMGHDVFRIEDNKLVRVFPIYKRNDSNHNPTGERRKLIYGLYPGEAMWHLKIEGSVRLQPSEE